ncbi:hypothetical protein FHQ22_12295, partial [Pasteurellaceae bacterium Phil31]
MAYVSQENKKEIIAEVKKVLPKGWKATFKVQNSSTLICTIKEMPKSDLISMAYDSKIESCEYARNYVLRRGVPSKFNEFLESMIWKDKAEKMTELSESIMIFSGNSEGSFENINFLNKKYSSVIFNLIKALNFKNYNHSDSMTDYFCVGYYIDLNFGYYDK